MWGKAVTGAQLQLRGAQGPWEGRFRTGVVASKAAAVLERPGHTPEGNRSKK